MSCYHPLDAWLSPPSPITGKRQLVFGGGLSRIQREKGALVADSYEPVQVPCGKCVGCRLDHARMWSIRCVHESQMCVESMFLTLTFLTIALSSVDKIWTSEICNCSTNACASLPCLSCAILLAANMAL